MTSFVVAVLSLAASANGGEKKSSKPTPVPIRIRVAACDEGPARSADWVERHVSAANEIFEPHGFVLRAEVETFSPKKCELETRADRHSLARFVDPDEITILVMKRVQDVDVPSYDLMGVHWRYRGKNPKLRGRRWVYLTARAKPPVLAHELCHYFGLPHDSAGGNLMTPGPSDPIWKTDNKPKPYRPILTKGQASRLVDGIKKRLKDVVKAE